MSRSNPNDHLQNPSQRWLEWAGAKGHLRYWDKVAERRVDVPLPFTFLLLDELATVTGWDKAGDCRIWANEVRNTTDERLIVKSKLSGIIAEGLYRDIKPTVVTAGGYYAANCYIAFKNLEEDAYQLGSIRFKGAALSAWLTFKNDKANRPSLYDKAIRISGFTEGKKGSIVFKVPTFEFADASAHANTAAKALDVELQKYLAAYLQRNKRDQQDEAADIPHDNDDTQPAVVDDSIIPF